MTCLLSFATDHSFTQIAGSGRPGCNPGHAKFKPGSPMKMFVVIVRFWWGTGWLAAAAAADLGEVVPVNRDQQAYELLQKADRTLRGTRMESTMTMTVIKDGEQRSFKIHSIEKDRLTSLVRILEPRRDRGTAFLKTAGKLWMYTPNVRRTIPIPAAMMGNSFMGSDVSYDDMSRESDMLKDFDVHYAGSEGCGSGECWRIELVPHEDTPVAYDREIVWITFRDGLYQRLDFIDDEGKTVKRLLFKDYRVEDGRPYPRSWEFLNLVESGRKTVITVDEVKFDHTYSESFFSKGALQEFRP